jgi:glutamate-5-semialdehyde dehydrogenase
VDGAGGVTAIAFAELVADVRLEAAAANAACGALSDERVADALHAMADRLRCTLPCVLETNASDLADASDQLDPGALDRLRLDPQRIEEIARQLVAVAELPPLERVIDSWTLENGLTVTARRIPIGVVGANFEARPGVALDIASQLLKSLNGCVLRTGAAALGTVTALVDHVVRPALERAGVPGAVVGLVGRPEREGAYALTSTPDLIPLVVLRGSGPTTAALGRHAAEHGVQVLAHAEGGGVLYVDRAADLEHTSFLLRASLDRLGVCNRLNVLLVHREIAGRLPAIVEELSALGLTVYGTERARRFASLALLAEPLGHEWANDPERVDSICVDVVESVGEAFLNGYRGTTAFWQAPTRFTDGAALMGIPETGINVGWAPGPRGPVTYRDLWLKQLRVVGDATQRR